MKQTKAAFRNKPFISLKGSILFLILIPMSGLIFDSHFDDHQFGPCSIFHRNNGAVDDTYR